MSQIASGQSPRISNTICILLLVFAGIAAAQAGPWEIGIVDGSLGGSFSSLRIDKYGNAHVASAGDAEATLQYSFWDHNLKKWFTTTLGRTSGFCSLALDSRQRPHISYVEYGASKMYHTFWDGSSWQKQPIQIPTRHIAFYTSISLDPNDNPSISFYDYLGVVDDQYRRLRVVKWNGGVWEVQTVDSEPGSGKFNSIAIDSVGRSHVAYCNVDPERASLRYARLGSTGWSHEILESGYSKSWQAVMLIVDKYDVPHMAYSDVQNGIVKYATQVNGKWQIQSVDSVGAVAYPDRNGLALDQDGTPYISYYDAKRGELKLAHRKGQVWLTEVVDGGFAGFTSSLQIHERTIWLTYSAGPGGGLKFARRLIESPDSEARPQTPAIPK